MGQCENFVVPGGMVWEGRYMQIYLISDLCSCFRRHSMENWLVAQRVFAVTAFTERK
jgi:hypothetical protein